MALKVSNESEILQLEAKARSLGIVAYVVEDEGRTQVAPGSKTVIALGPAPQAAFEGLTSNLKLL